MEPAKEQKTWLEGGNASWLGSVRDKASQKPAKRKEKVTLQITSYGRQLRSVPQSSLHRKRAALAFRKKIGVPTDVSGESLFSNL